MFASTFPRAAASRQLGGLYQQVGVETQLAGASPHHLVAMLFDGCIEALAQARGAMRAGHTEIKGRAIARALGIVQEGLRAGLDLKVGGPLARDLDDLYAYVAGRLTLANVRNDESALEECQRLIQPLREAWASIAPGAPGANGTATRGGR